MKKIEYKLLNEKLYYDTLENGLQLFFIPKPGFTKYYVGFSTKYGSSTNVFIPHGKSDYLNAPYGVAHFLEHELFEKEDEDVSKVFSNYGIESNAYTSYVETCYFITGSSNFEIGITYLLDSIQNPYFNDKKIKKEQGIIIEEIKMVLDSPSDKLYNGLMNNMYSKHSRKEEIAGTPASVNKITKEILYDTYNTFYNPSNMTLIIVGDFTDDYIYNLVNSNQRSKKYDKINEIHRKTYIEENRVCKRYDESTMDIVFPKVAVGLKLPQFSSDKNNLMKIEAIFKIILESSFGMYTDNYQFMLDNELVNGGFSYNATISATGCFVKIQADTSKPKEFIDYITNKLLEINRCNHITKEKVERYKKSIIGYLLKNLGDVEYIGYSFTDFYYMNSNMFDIVTVIEELKFEEIVEYTKYFVRKAITAYQLNPENIA